MIFAVALVLSCASTQTEPASSTEQFAYQPERIEIRTVYHYIKSDLAGGNPARVILYIATESHLEVVKIEQGTRDLAYVTADLDWATYSAHHMTSWNVLPNGMYRRQAHMTFDRTTHTLDTWMPGGSERVTTEHYPFHIYNFDFLSLNYVFRHLKDPEGKVDIGIVDPTWKESGPKMAYQGLAHIEHVGDETYKGTRCRKYKVGGPGLNGQFGWIWADYDLGHFVNVEHPWRDNPDWSNFKLELQSVDRMSLPEWHAFVDAEIKALRDAEKR